jgi:integrase
MSAQQVELALGAVDFREKVILRLAVFAGMRPGELLAIQREHVKPAWALAKSDPVALG